MKISRYSINWIETDLGRVCYFHEHGHTGEVQLGVEVMEIVIS